MKTHLKPWVVLISADAEWKAVRDVFPQIYPDLTPFGETIQTKIKGKEVIYFQGGWGKVSAAASAQYAIDHFHPEVIANLGTCGGIKGKVERGEVLLVNETYIYDIHEQMGDPRTAIQDYSVKLDLSWLPEVCFPVRRTRLLSADKDILPSEIKQLEREYHLMAADWESGAIAWVAQKNSLRCFILRMVTDIVSEEGGEIYGDYPAFIQKAWVAIHKLLEILPLWISN